LDIIFWGVFIVFGEKEIFCRTSENSVVGDYDKKY